MAGIEEIVACIKDFAGREDFLNQLTEQAKANPRKRMNYNLHHSYEENPQIMLNAIEPESYVPPHRHINPRKSEFFALIRGHFAVAIFDDKGRIKDATILSPNQEISCIVKHGDWHSLVSYQTGSIILRSEE